MRERHKLSASVFVVVQDAGRVLLLRRKATGWMDGHLSLPAGGLDQGESMPHAAARELHEETGLSVAPRDLELIHLLHCKSGDTGGDWLGAFFLARHWHGTPIIGEPDKHDALGWHALDALPVDLIPYARQGLAWGLAGVPHSTYGWQPSDDEPLAVV